MKTRPLAAREAAEALAIQALSFIAGDAERLGHFLAVTGIGPGEIRAAAREPRFLAGVLEFLVSNHKLAAEFAAEGSYTPADLANAHIALGGEPWEREIP
jgi:uncharacterized protein DUF3572